MANARLTPYICRFTKFYKDSFRLSLSAPFIASQVVSHAFRMIAVLIYRYQYAHSSDLFSLSLRMLLWHFSRNGLATTSCFRMSTDYIFIQSCWMLTTVLCLQALSRWTFLYSRLRCWLSIATALRIWPYAIQPLLSAFATFTIRTVRSFVVVWLALGTPSNSMSFSLHVAVQVTCHSSHRRSKARQLVRTLINPILVI